MSDRKKNISINDYFDSAWYCEKYHDVTLWSGDPLDHFQKYGKLLNRSPGPNFDTSFYLNTYSDALKTESAPIEQFLSCPDYAHRPVTPFDLHKRMKQLSADMHLKWQSVDAKNARKIKISYCIPVMGRLDDLRQTLKINLDENREFEDVIEFLIVEFGENLEVTSWIEENFTDDLAKGYLRSVHDSRTLDSWHFGKAKNAFRSHLWGEIYSSLDGDNFVTSEETRFLINLAEVHSDGFIFHHFSGQWGDGTSGRVSMPSSIYRHVGYNSLSLPRQYDEMDLILGSLVEFPALPFIGVDPLRNAFNLSYFVKKFCEEEQLPNRMIFPKYAPRRVAPLNPRGADYTDTAIHWRDMNNFNAAVTALRRGRRSSFKEKNAALVARHKYHLIESLPKSEIIKTLFWIEAFAEIDPIKTSDICVATCVRNEESFLRRFVSHHRDLGVTHFLIVDDHSAEPVSEMDLGSNVLVVRPKVGDFRNAKTLWIEGLIKAFVPEGNWICTLDADEMLQLPNGFSDLRQVTQQLEDNNQEFATCLLLDMLPDPSLMPSDFVRAENEFESILTKFCFKNEAVSAEYAEHRSIKWGFGPHAEISNRVDARYHAFGTFDSLRKLSLFRYRQNRHLNQGFHSFHYLDGKPGPGADIWETPLILPIFHYKLAKLFSDVRRTQMLNNASGYHARTGENISQIFGSNITKALSQISALKPFLRDSSYAHTHWSHIITSTASISSV